MAGLLVATVFPIAASLPAPEVWPTCPSPQPIGPAVPLNGAYGSNTRAAVVFDGAAFGIFEVGSVEGVGDQLLFQRRYADGSLVPGSAWQLTGATVAAAPSAVWDGTAYGVAWTAPNSVTGMRAVYFTRVKPDGTILVPKTCVSDPANALIKDTAEPAIAWSGTSYLVTYTLNFAAGDEDVYFVTVGTNGTLGPRTVIDAGINFQRKSSVAWSEGEQQYKVAYQSDYDSSGNFSIYLKGISRAGAIDGSWGGLAATGTSPALAPSGTSVVMAYMDSSGSGAIKLARVTSGISWQWTVVTGFLYASPRVVWTGASWAVFYQTLGGLLLNTVNSQTGSVSSQVALMVGEVGTPDAAFNGATFMITGVSGFSRPVHFAQPIGCTTDTTPPTCPGNLLAYGLSGTTATVAWSPSSDEETGLAFYRLYRNNSPLATTAATYYADSGLSPGVTYNYMVQPVNANQQQNTACTGSIYVKASAVTLRVDKNSPNALLSWTDGGMNNYNIFRGTDPRVMSLIGSTGELNAEDPNVLLDNVLYFYTVDDPGW